MPNQIRSTMNQLIRAEATAAEINGATRPFVAYSLPKLQSQRALIWGVVWSVFATAVDRPGASAQLILQRNLILEQNTPFPASEVVNEMIFLHLMDQNTDLADTWFPAKPLPLEPGNSYALVLTIVPRAAFANAAFLQLTVFGEFEPFLPDADISL